MTPDGAAAGTLGAAATGVPFLLTFTRSPPRRISSCCTSSAASRCRSSLTRAFASARSFFGSAILAPASQQERRVVAAEAHRVGQRDLDLLLARDVRHVVKVADGIRHFLV